MQTEGIEVPLTAIDQFTQVFNNMDKNLADLAASNREMLESQAAQQQANEETTSSWTELNSAYSLVTQAFEQGKAIFDATFGAFQEYAGEVRDLALVSGTTAEEASRLLQVFDDFQISASDVNSAMKAMKNQGMVPTIETIAQLSDQFLAIEDPAERLKFAQDNLGRSASSYYNILSKGSKVILENAAAVSENLILTDEQIKKAELQRLALDELGDAWEGLKIQVGAYFGEIILNTNNHEEVIERLKEQGIEVYRGIEYSQEYKDVLAQLQEEQLAVNDAVAANVEVLEEDEEAIKAASEANQDLHSLMSDFQGIAEGYQEKMTDLAAEQDALMAKKQELVNQGYSAEGEAISEINEKLAENIAKQQEATAEAEKAIKQKIVAMVSAGLEQDGLTTQEFDALVKLEAQWGLLSQEAATSAQEVYGAVQNYLQTGDIDNFTRSVETAAFALTTMPEEKTVNLAFTVSANGQLLTPEQMEAIFNGMQ